MTPYENYVKNFGIILRRYGVWSFTPQELASEKAGVPPVNLWDNALLTVLRLQKIRDYFDLPIYVNTKTNYRRGYRNKKSNEAVGGASGSIHMSFNAFDFSIPGVPPRECYHEALKLFPEAETSLWGLGLYPTFVHLDTRGLIGRKAPARWVA